MVTAADPVTRQDGSRCAVHPSRPALDACPTCARPRCGVDAGLLTDACFACTTQSELAPRSEHRAPTELERIVRAVIALSLCCVPAGVIVSEYVGTKYFSWITPGLAGVVLGWVAMLVSRVDMRSQSGLIVRVAAILYALVATGFGFRFVPGGESPFHPFGRVALPYFAAAVGAWLWTMPPRRRQGRGTWKNLT